MCCNDAWSVTRLRLSLVGFSLNNFWNIEELKYVELLFDYNLEC